MDLELLVLIGLLCAGTPLADGTGGSGSGLLFSDVESVSMPLMPFTSTSSSAEILIPPTTHLTPFTVSTVLPSSSSTSFLLAMPTPTQSLLSSSSIYITRSVPLLTQSLTRSLQFPSTTLLSTMPSSSSSSAAFILQPSLTRSPTHSSSSYLQFPSTTLLPTMPSSSSSSNTFILQPSLTRSPTHSSSSYLQFPSTTLLPTMPSSSSSSNTFILQPSLTRSPTYSSSSYLQFPFTTLLSTMPSSSSSSAAFIIQPSLTHSPTHSSSSYLQFPSTLLPTMPSSSSSSAAFILQPSLTRSLTHSSSSYLQFPSTTLLSTMPSFSSSSAAFTLQPSLTRSPTHSSSSYLQFPSTTLLPTMPSSSSSSATFILQPSLTRSPTHSSSSYLQFPSTTLLPTMPSSSSSSNTFILQPSLTRSPTHSYLQFPSTTLLSTMPSSSSSSATFALQPSLTHLPSHSSSSYLQFPSTTLLSTMPSSSSSSNTFALQPSLTHSPTHSSSSFLQFPFSALPDTVSSASSTGDAFTFEPTTSPSFTYHIIPTPSYPPLLLPTENINSSQPTTFHPNEIPLTVILPGAVAGVVIVVVFPSLVVIVCVTVWCRRKTKAHHKLYSINPHKDLCIFTKDDENEQEYIDMLSEVSHHNSFNFGITTETFGINIGSTDGESGATRPPLIFINAVDPMIPVTSNTLTRCKAKSNNIGLDLGSHFDTSSSNHLGKGYKSVEHVHQVSCLPTDNLLTQDCHLKEQELTKQKANKSNRSLSNDDIKASLVLIANSKSDGIEHMFIESLGSSKTSTFKLEREDVNSDPKELLKTDASFSDKLSSIDVQTSVTCTSHYDVPKKLRAEIRHVTYDEKLGNTNKETWMPKKESSAEENMDANKKRTSQPTNVNLTHFTTESDMKPTLGDNYQVPTKPASSPTELDRKSSNSPFSKPEATYDKACSFEPGLSKPKVTPRNLNTKFSGKSIIEGIYDGSKSTVLLSSLQIVKHDDIGKINCVTDALAVPTYQKAAEGSEITTETSAVIKPHLMPKPKRTSLVSSSQIIKHDDSDHFKDALPTSACQIATANVETSTEASQVTKPYLMPKPKKIPLLKTPKDNWEFGKPPADKVKPTPVPRQTAVQK